MIQILRFGDLILTLNAHFTCYCDQERIRGRNVQLWITKSKVCRLRCPHKTAIMALAHILAGNRQDEVLMSVLVGIASHNAQRQAQAPSSNNTWRWILDFDITIANTAVECCFSLYAPAVIEKAFW